MSPSLLHISDIHPVAGQDLGALADDIHSAVGNHFEIGFLVVSGDLGCQGRNQELAARFITRLARKFGIGSESIICVPGNHDLQLNQPHSPFELYSQAVFKVVGDAARAQAQNASRYLSGKNEFLLLNSAFHLTKDYGRVDCKALRGLLDSSSDSSTRIAVVHHHPIPVEDPDRSSIVNAYELLRLISDAGYDVLLHGHRHMAMSLHIGTKTLLAGVGSVNFTPKKNINNQFNVIDVGKKVARFRYQADSTKAGRVGRWELEEEPWP